MNGYDIYKKAITRLGYTDGEDSRFIEKAFEFICQICADLKLEQIADLTQEMRLDTEQVEALCCGMAMLLSLSEGDGEKHRMFCELYNAKRAGVLSKSSVIEDRLPTVGSEGV